MTENPGIKILNHIRPIHLLTTLGLYLLGIGIARYLGQRIDYSLFLAGSLWLFFFQQGFYFLSDYLGTPFELGLMNRINANSDQNNSAPTQPAEGLIYISLSCFAAAAVVTFYLIFKGEVSISLAVLMGLFFAAFGILSIPRITLDLSGIGEILTSITLILFPPAFGFFLQYGDFHRFLAFGIFPLFPLHFAMILLFRLSDYKNDLRKNRKTLLVRIGWIQGIFIHNLMIFSGFLLFGIALIFGFPSRLMGFPFLTLPLALYLVWYLSKLEDGAPVRWPLLWLLSLAVFFLPIYLITYSSWVY